MTQDRLLARLRREAAESSWSAVARKYAISISYISKVANGETPIGPKLALAMGYRKEVVFRKIA